MPNVGQVHIGIVYTLQLDDSEMELDFETTMLNTEFISKPLNTIKYEKWSQLILNRYNDIIDGIPG
jgi:predicted NUDIX family phosphoesterase